jgi:serine phosphatase RsbU (regulator of sigma subunit)
VVSGDFYWWAKIEDKLVIAIADCTGHGVPGAFMSLLGISFLREIIAGEYISQPDVVLRRLRKRLVAALKQKVPAEQQFSFASEIKDGMDIAVAEIKTKEMVLHFSGANNPLWLIRKAGESESMTMPDVLPQAVVYKGNGHALYEFKGDNMPVGVHDRMDKFTDYEIKLQHGDMLYMLSDGFADQFGGPKGKKFKDKPLKELLLSISDKPLNVQNEILERTLDEWKNGYETNYGQTDDITVMGIKIK